MSAQREDVVTGRVGSDRVEVRGARVVVSSRADMPGWEVRQYRRVAILFRGSRWFVAQKERSGAGFRYTLERWPEDREDIDGGVVEYGERFVAERDSAAAARSLASGAQRLLVPLYPLIGLLPAALKRRLADRFGIAEDRATALSLWLELMAIFALGALYTIQAVARVYGPALGVRGVPWLDGVGPPVAVVLMLLVPDLIVRYSRIIAESTYSYGFWEWLFRRSE